MYVNLRAAGTWFGGMGRETSINQESIKEGSISVCEEHRKQRVKNGTLAKS